MLNSTDIQNKKFDIAKKGYNVAQIDAFLDELVATVKACENDADELARFRAIEKQLSQALIMAQTKASSVVEEAEKEADEKIAIAEEQAERILTEAYAAAEERTQALEAEQQELKEEIARLKEFADTYKDCILKDMENHRVAFEQAFLSEAIYDENSELIAEEEPMPEEAVAEEPTAEPEAAEEQGAELDTGEMESIDLSELVKNLPNADEELKALIDDII